MKTLIVLILLFVTFLPCLAVDDLPIYLDGGCPNTGLPKSYASGPSSMEIAQLAEGNMNHPIATDRDNAAETFLAHPRWWVDGGFIGILFGAGNPGCANYQNDNDNGWFVQHMKAYNDNPYPFPATGILVMPAGCYFAVGESVDRLWKQPFIVTGF